LTPPLRKPLALGKVGPLRPAFSLFGKPTLSRSNIPDDGAVSLAAARAAFAKGDVAATERLCKSLVETAPQAAGAWSLLAETALLRDRPDAARICAAKATALAPRDAIARIVEAKIFFQSGELLEALQAAQAAEPLLGDDPAAADALAAIFGLLGRHEAALGLSQRAVATRPEAPQYLFNLAATERMLGTLDSADAHCGAAIAQAPKFALAHYIRADLRIQTPERNHIAEMEAVLGAGDLDWRAQTTLRYALAKECEDIGEDTRAFAHVAAGAALWRANTPYDARAELATIDRLIGAGPAKSSRAGGIAHAPIFICGLPRTGTTLIERIVASHSGVAAVGETGAFAVEAGRALRQNPAKPDFDGLGARYVGVVKGVFAPQKPRFVDKTLQNYLYCGLIAEALPKAKIILVERDPFDAAWALYKAHFNGGFLFSYDLEELADYCRAYRRLVAHWKSTLGPERLLTVAYEDVVHDLPGQSRRIAAFLELPWEEEILRFHESRAPSATASAVQVRRPIYASSIGRWRRHAQGLQPFIARMAT
jgi:tetratricopeptide (TPR) repeat protein